MANLQLTVSRVHGHIEPGLLAVLANAKESLSGDWAAQNIEG